MPSKHVVRNFAENQYYHIFNRGVEKRKIFLDDQDHKMFLYYLFIYLAPLEKVLEKYPHLPLRLQAKNLSKELDLIVYCLIPNHFHLLLKQKNKDAISKFMKQLTNAYTIYFNNKYKRVGGLVQGRFKAVNIENDDLLLHISHYIHLNPVASNLVKNLEDYKWSSYPSYIDKAPDFVCKKEIVLSHFPSLKKYEEFVMDQISYSQELEKIKHLVLDPED